MNSELVHIARRASHNARKLAEALEAMREDEVAYEELLRTSPEELSCAVDSRWASIVLLSLWNTLRGQEEPIRPHIKTAIQHLGLTPTRGSSKAVADLAKLVLSCWIAFENRSSELAPIWETSTPGEVVSIQIKGATLPTTADALSLVEDFERSLHAIAEIISSGTEPRTLFPSDRFPHLALLPARGEAEMIWSELYLKLSLIIHLSSDGLGLEPISDGFSAQIYSELGRSTAFGKPEIGSLLIKPDEDITAYPVVEYAATLWSSSYLLLDSIAPGLLATIQKTSLREAVISQPFEDSVVSLLRENGFVAGSVDDKGTWRTQHGATRLHGRTRLPGQIDVLAQRDDGLFVLECKSIYSLGQLRNIAEKLGLHTHNWRTKLAQKRVWVEEATGRDVDLALVLVEGIAEYVYDGEADAKVPLLTLEAFSKLVASVGVPPVSDDKMARR